MYVCSAKEYAGHSESTGTQITENEAAGIGVFGILFICVMLSLSIAFCRLKIRYCYYFIQITINYLSIDINPRATVRDSVYTFLILPQICGVQ